MNVLITGSTGFVGKNLLSYLKKYDEIKPLTISLRNNLTEPIVINDSIDTVIHLAGKAHDLKKAVEDANEYYQINTELTKKLYESFNNSNASCFIYISSVKAVSDSPLDILDEHYDPNPITTYGKSKLAAEQILLKNKISTKRLYILRPCMIHGPNNKGNLNLLFNLVDNRIPYPLGLFNNKRSFLSIDNLNFIITELLINREIPSGTYNVCDNETYSTTEIIRLMGKVLNKHVFIFSVPKSLILILARIGDAFNLPVNTHNLNKLTENYVVSNSKILNAIGKKLPLSGTDGFINTFTSFVSKENH